MKTRAALRERVARRRGDQLKPLEFAESQERRSANQ